MPNQLIIGPDGILVGQDLFPGGNIHGLASQSINSGDIVHSRGWDSQQTGLIQRGQGFKSTTWAGRTRQIQGVRSESIIGGGKVQVRSFTGFDRVWVHALFFRLDNFQWILGNPKAEAGSLVSIGKSEPRLAVHNSAPCRIIAREFEPRRDNRSDSVIRVRQTKTARDRLILGDNRARVRGAIMTELGPWSTRHVIKR